MDTITHVETLLRFAEARGLLAQEDKAYTRNRLYAALGVIAPDAQALPASSEALPETVTPLLRALCDAAMAKGLVEDIPFDREQFSAHLMDIVTPPPSGVIARFRALREAQGSEAATDWFYQFCRSNDYIRVDEIAKNQAFGFDSDYGTLEITINLSKPEKDPKEIARAKEMPAANYPKCMLCVENEGFTGYPGYPSHASMRVVPIELGAEDWRLQFSPYSYYPEHCIALNSHHVPMAISRRSFELLFDFVSQFPHYFIGSNADLSIVGGSILSHDHFQGGRHIFPMDKAPAYQCFSHPDFEGVSVEAVRWPMTCIRLRGTEPASIIALADAVLSTWRAYDDSAREILHTTDGRSHNTITPIARLDDDGTYTLQLVLRNNRTTDEHPLGIFHPHADLHHVKRENIGLIEVMGLFILPGRLLGELDALAVYLTGERPLTEKPADDDPLAKHYDWMLEIAEKQGNLPISKEAARAALQAAVGEKCTRVLEDSGVFKATPDGDQGLASFLASVGIISEA